MDRDNGNNSDYGQGRDRNWDGPQSVMPDPRYQRPSKKHSSSESGTSWVSYDNKHNEPTKKKHKDKSNHKRKHKDKPERKHNKHTHKNHSTHKK